MAASLLEPQTEKLLILLSRLPASQLVIAISQYTDLSHFVSNALRDLAAAALRNDYPEGQKKQSNIIADLARKLISRGDPSLVNKLILNQSSLIDLAICTDAKDVLARLIDDTTAEECIQAAMIASKRASEDQDASMDMQAQRVCRAARALARVVSSMPKRKVAEDKLSRAQKDRRREVVKMYCEALHKFSATYDITSQRQAEARVDDEHLLLSKVALLDAAFFIVERLVSQASPSNAKVVSNDLLASLQDGEVAYQNGTKTLEDASMIVDLLLIRPDLMEMIQVDASQPSSSILAGVKSHISQIRVQKSGSQILNEADTAWIRVISSMSIQNKKVVASDDTIESIIGILPHLATEREELARRLQSSKFAGRSTEEIISLLLQQEEEGAALLNEDEDTKEQSEGLRLLQERADIFNDESLKAMTVTRGKAVDRNGASFELSSGLSEEMRAAILARAEQQESDAGEEEWNPFSDNAYEVGFEEELGMESEEISKAKSAPDRESNDGEMEEEEEGDGDEAAGHGSGADGRSNSVAAERAAERILISNWSDKGETLFKKEARKTSARLDLIKKLNDLPGRKWDDGLVESWGTMFARNPRKEKLLSSVDDIMRVGNTNITSDGGDAVFGPNRGRGGRILTGDRGSSRGGRGRGQSRGRGHRGGAAKRGRGA